MAVDLHISVTVAVEGSEHDAEWPGPVTEQHEQTVSQWLLGEDGPPLVYWTQTGMKLIHKTNSYKGFVGTLTDWK